MKNIIQKKSFTIQLLMIVVLIFNLIFFSSGCGILSGKVNNKSVPVLSSTQEFGVPKQVAIFYEDDPTQAWNYGKVYAIHMRNLLGHFNTDVNIINVGNYARGILNQYDAAIYIGSIYDYPLNDAFLEDVFADQRPFLWINYNIWKFFKRPEWNAKQHFGFDYFEVQNIRPFTNVLYKGQRLPRLGTDVEFNNVNLEVGSQCSELARIEVQQDGELLQKPYTIRCKNFYYMAQNPLANFFASYLVLADILHDLLGTQVQPSVRALVRFEDLLPGNVNYDVLREEVDTLYQMGVPFAFGVIPENYDPTGVYGQPGLKVDLHKDFLLQNLIKYMISKGGTPVMHGYTHQHDINSAIDYEFWDGKNDKPFPEDSYSWALDRVDKGIAEFKLALRFSPIIWETPHYSASPNTYFAVASRFSVVYGRLPIFNSLEMPNAEKSVDYSQTKYITYTVPYQLFNTFYGFRILPENLGYLQRDGTPELGFPPTPQGKEDLAKMYSVVRDGVVSFMFHHWQPQEDLYDTVKRIQKLGYKFVSVQDLLKDTPPAYR